MQEGHELGEGMGRDWVGDWYEWAEDKKEWREEIIRIHYVCMKFQRMK